MATASRVRGSAAAEREHHRTSLWAQLARFVGLFLSPIIGLVGAWLIHVWAAGFHIHWGRYRWDVDTPRGMAVVVAIALALLTLWIATKARQFAEHRAEPLQQALFISVMVLGIMFAVGVGVGPSYVWSGLFFICAWAVAVIWSIARLDVTRNDKHAEGEKAEGFWEKLGIDPRTKIKAKLVHDPVTGEPVRVDADVHHAPGETAEVFREAGLDGIASAAAGPPGMTSVGQNPDRADRSTLSVPLTDPFKRPAYVGPLSAPRKSIGEWITISDYANGKVARFTLGNGVNSPTPTSYGLIGMTRAGKTGTETQILTEAGSRRDWTLLYLNQAKGLQDIAPLWPIIEAAMIADDEAQAKGDARVAVKQVRAIMAYRQKHLAAHGVSAWSPRCCDPNPDKRPTRLGADAKRHVMEPTPMFTMHMGEADSLLADGKIGDDVIFIGSKGLSLGVNVGVSLQKPDFRSMPTNLRSQIGLWFVHGLAQSDDEEFLIETELRKSGVNPGRWGQRKPGQHYMIGANVEDETNFTVAAKTRFIIGSTTDGDGNPFSFDELNDRYMAEMLRRNTESAKYKARLDRGSAEATEGWWDEQVARAADMRSAKPSANRPATASATADYVPPGLRGRPQPQTEVADDDEPTSEEITEMHEDAATVTEVEGVELYPNGEGADVDLTRNRPPMPDPAPEDDPLYDPEEEAKPAARDRPAALEALAAAYEELLADDSLRDPRDPEAVIVGPGMVADRYRFRSQPWFSAEMSEHAEGRGELATRYVLSLAEDLGIRNGKYRLRRVAAHAE